MSFIICTLSQMLLGWTNQAEWGGRVRYHSWGQICISKTWRNTLV